MGSKTSPGVPGRRNQAGGGDVNPESLLKAWPLQGLHPAPHSSAGAWVTGAFGLIRSEQRPRRAYAHWLASLEACYRNTQTRANFSSLSVVPSVAPCTGEMAEDACDMNEPVSKAASQQSKCESEAFPIQASPLAGTGKEHGGARPAPPKPRSRVASQLRPSLPWAFISSSVQWE